MLRFFLDQMRLRFIGPRLVHFSRLNERELIGLIELAKKSTLILSYMTSTSKALPKAGGGESGSGTGEVTGEVKERMVELEERIEVLERMLGYQKDHQVDKNQI